MQANREIATTPRLYYISSQLWVHVPWAPKLDRRVTNCQPGTRESDLIIETDSITDGPLCFRDANTWTALNAALERRVTFEVP